MSSVSVILCQKSIRESLPFRQNTYIGNRARVVRRLCPGRPPAGVCGSDSHTMVSRNPVVIAPKVELIYQDAGVELPSDYQAMTSVDVFLYAYCSLAESQRIEIGLVHHEANADRLTLQTADVARFFPAHDAGDVVTVDNVAVVETESRHRLTRLVL